MQSKPPNMSRRTMLAVPGVILASELTRTTEAQAANYWALRHYGNAPVGYWQEFLDAYVCAENAGNAPLNASRSAIGEWELFDFIIVSGQNIKLRAKINNKYVARDPATELLKASKTSSTDAQIFYVDTSGLSGGLFKLRATLGGGQRYVHLTMNDWDLCLSSNANKGFPATFYQTR